MQLRPYNRLAHLQKLGQLSVFVAVWLFSVGTAQSSPVVPAYVKIDGKINDLLRADYIKRHIDWVLKARKEGANLNGYVVWSGWDNFEWVAGYTKRLGLIYVDFATQERTPKQSFYDYQKLIRTHKGL